MIKSLLLASVIACFIISSNTVAQDKEPTEIPPLLQVLHYVSYYGLEVAQESGSFGYYTHCLPPTGDPVVRNHYLIRFSTEAPGLPSQYAWLQPQYLYWFVPDAVKPNIQIKVAFEDSNGHVGEYSEWSYYDELEQGCLPVE